MAKEFPDTLARDSGIDIQKYYNMRDTQVKMLSNLLKGKYETAEDYRYLVDAHTETGKIGPSAKYRSVYFLELGNRPYCSASIALTKGSEAIQLSKMFSEAQNVFTDMKGFHPEGGFSNGKEIIDAEGSKDGYRHYPNCKNINSITIRGKGFDYNEMSYAFQQIEEDHRLKEE